MTRSELAAFEVRRVQELAEEYRRRGYQVDLDPPPLPLTNCPTGYRPDLVAKRDEETVVIEVRSHQTLSEQPYIVAIAEAVKAQPGWTFELVVANPASTEEVATDELGPAPLSPSCQQQFLREARRLLAEDLGGPSLLMAWIAVEAKLREMVRRDEIVGAWTLSTAALVKQAYAYGLIDREQLDALTAGMDARNRVAHGFEPPTNVADCARQLIVVADELVVGEAN